MSWLVPLIRIPPRGVGTSGHRSWLKFKRGSMASSLTALMPSSMPSPKSKWTVNGTRSPAD
eukprot:3541157-Pyramimonas_sp.AAC.1